MAFAGGSSFAIDFQQVIDRTVAIAVIARSLATAFQARATGDAAGAKAAWEQTIEYARRHELEVQPALDVHEFIATVGRRFR